MLRLVQALQAARAWAQRQVRMHALRVVRIQPVLALQVVPMLPGLQV